MRGLGYIGFRMLGAWDEMTIERADLQHDHPLIRECVESMTKRLGQNWEESGSPSRNMRTWSALVVHLGDGCALQVVAADFDVVPSQP
jgi:hypothetical protein